MDCSSKGTMSHGVVNQLDQFPLEEFSSPLSGQIFELCDPDLFSEVNSNSICCYEANSFHTKDFKASIPNVFENDGKTNIATTTSTANSSATPQLSTAINNNHLSIIFDSPEEVENVVNDPIDFPTFPQLCSTTSNDNQQNQLDLSSIPSQNQLRYPPHDPQNLPLVGPLLPCVLEDECLSFIPSSMRSNLNPSGPSNAFTESTIGSYFPGNSNSIDNSAILTSGLYLNGNNEIQIQDLDFQGDNGGGFSPDGFPRFFNPKDLQALSNDSQHVANGDGSANPLASELSSLDDSAFKIRKLSPEERREKIHRYMKKRNERNFSKKIKYACRKTLADSRPRVRGRFAKNDELLNESLRAACSNHEDDIDEDSLPIVVKEEEMFDSSDIFAHISGVNSFKCNYTSIPSWI